VVSEKDVTYTVPVNGLTAAEGERLALLLEELGEAQQAIGKILRHGYESHNPLITSVSPSNRESLETELGHVQHAIDRLTLAQDIRVIAVNGAKKAKAETVRRWLHHQEGL
jgi:hypothetical protein